MNKLIWNFLGGGGGGAKQNNHLWGDMELHIQDKHFFEELLIKNSFERKLIWIVGFEIIIMYCLD